MFLFCPVYRKINTKALSKNTSGHSMKLMLKTMQAITRFACTAVLVEQLS